LLSAFNVQVFSAFAQSTTFTYQGRLNDGAAPANGGYDLRFALFDLASGGAQQGNTLTNSATAVSNGLFTVTLDFGNQFLGADRWLELAVRTKGGGGFSALAPRQHITPKAYALTAGKVSAGAGLAGTYSNAVTFNNAENSFAGSGAGLSALDASQLTSGTVPNAVLPSDIARTDQVWLLGGNAGTLPGANFLGTTDNQPLELRVNRARAIRLEASVNNVSSSNLVNVVGGSPDNFVSFGIRGATI